ncbi:hypothetical protein Tco_0746590 [Tanacetum coccineum]
MPGAYAVPRRDSNFEMVSSIDVRSYSHGSGASDLFRQTSAPRDSCGFMQYALRTTFCGGKSLNRSGYYWPTRAPHALRQDQRNVKDCQVHRPIPAQTQQDLTPITVHHWQSISGVSTSLAPSPSGGRIEIPLSCYNYFTKWIEAKRR